VVEPAPNLTALHAIAPFVGGLRDLHTMKSLQELRVAAGNLHTIRGLENARISLPAMRYLLLTVILMAFAPPE